MQHKNIAAPNALVSQASPEFILKMVQIARRQARCDFIWLLLPAAKISPALVNQRGGVLCPFGGEGEKCDIIYVPPHLYPLC